MTAHFGRLMTAMITPMTPDGEVNLTATAEFARALVSSGTETIVSTGSTGEAPALSAEEKVAVWRATKEAVGASAAVIAGATNADTRESIRLAQAAERLGLDGVLMTVPAYSKPTQEGLVRHFTAIAQATSLPGLLYNVPSRTGLNMTAETALRLAQVPNIVGTKEASSDFKQIAAIIDGAPEGFLVWSGNDSETLPMMSLGAYGVVSVAAHLVGRQIRGLISAQLEGRAEEAAAIHQHLLPLVNALFVESNPIPVKAALEEAGFPAGPPRLPLTPATPETREILRAELATHQVDLAVAVGS